MERLHVHIYKNNVNSIATQRGDGLARCYQNQNQKSFSCKSPTLFPSFTVGITLVITGMKHSTKASIPCLIGRAGSYLPLIISSCFDSKSSLKILKLGYRIFTDGKNNNRRNGMAQVKFAISEILHLNCGKEEHIFKGSRKIE